MINFGVNAAVTLEIVVVYFAFVSMFCTNQFVNFSYRNR